MLRDILFPLLNSVPKRWLQNWPKKWPQYRPKKWPESIELLPWTGRSRPFRECRSRAASTRTPARSPPAAGGPRGRTWIGDAFLGGQILFWVQGWRYFLGQRWCVLCFGICIPSLPFLPLSRLECKLAKQNTLWPNKELHPCKGRLKPFFGRNRNSAFGNWRFWPKTEYSASAKCLEFGQICMRNMSQVFRFSPISQY